MKLEMTTALAVLALWIQPSVRPAKAVFPGQSAMIAAPARRRAVPEFSLLEQSGARITLADLRGKVWIADFIYTSCPDTCPLETADMARLQSRWRGASDLRLVSFSVDPERDTPEILARYARRFKAEPRRWLFLTGARPAILHLVEDGFHLAVASAAKNPQDAGLIVHSPRFVLIDRQGLIRGYYDTRDPQALQRLDTDVAALLENK